jgi:hypothetical protein
VPGGRTLPYIGAGLSLAMLFLSLYEPYKNAGGTVPDEWIVLAVWAVLGRVFWGMAARLRDKVSEEDRRWLLLHEGAGDEADSGDVP